MYLVQPRRPCESPAFLKGEKMCSYCLPSPFVSAAAPMFVWFSSLPRFVTARLLRFMSQDFLFLGPIGGVMARHRKREVDLQGEMSARTISCVEAPGISEEKDIRHRRLQIQANARDFLRMASDCLRSDSRSIYCTAVDHMGDVQCIPHRRNHLSLTKTPLIFIL